jgi:N-acetylneuraminic acid mutarotase
MPKNTNATDSPVIPLSKMSQLSLIKSFRQGSQDRELTLLALPDEVILSILGRLPLDALLSCTLVSKAMNRLAKDPSLYRSLFVSVKNEERGMPSARLWCSSVTHKDKLYVYGGHVTQHQSNLISNVKSDLHEFDFATSKWTELTHTMAGKTEHKCVVYNDSLYFVGGYNGCDYTNDIFRYDIATGQSVVVEAQGERFSPRSALTAVTWKNTMITFGGWNGFTKTWFNDVFEYNFDTNTWRQIKPKGPLPSQRTSHAACLYKNCMYVFAGYSGDKYLNDLWEFNLDTQTWRDVTPLMRGTKPEARSRFCAAVLGDKMYILGGWNKVTYFADIHAYNFLSNTWSDVSNENFDVPALSQYSWSLHKRSVYIFGGFCSRKKDCSNQLYTCNLLPHVIDEDVVMEDACEEPGSPSFMRGRSDSLERARLAAQTAGQEIQAQ